jgi:O-antigen ligase
LILNDLKSAQKLFWFFFVPLALATAKVFVHHATLNFGFKEINEATFPFFRNHVNYAAILALSIPLAWFVWGWYRRWTFRWWLMFGILGMLFLGLLFAYTRAAYLALVMAMGAYWVIRWRLVSWVLAAGTVLAVVVFVVLVRENKFMDLAPSERTIAHTDFNDIVSATYKLEDVSTMERYYRWIAGVRMADENVWVGFGPGNFYTFYKEYTLNRFTTYVSRNPEQSGIHNYFLMTLAEQGIFGLVIFLGLIFSVLIYGQGIYHQLQNPQHKDLAMGLMLSQIVIYAFLLMNDMVETDKVGSFFFLNMALLVALKGWEAPSPPKSADKI